MNPLTLLTVTSTQGRTNLLERAGASCSPRELGQRETFFTSTPCSGIFMVTMNGVDSQGILNRELAEANTVFNQNITTIDIVLDNIARKNFDRTAVENIQELKRLGLNIEDNYLKSLSPPDGGKSADEYISDLSAASDAAGNFISSSTNAQIEEYLKYFYTHFLLTNEAEKANIVAINKARDDEARFTGEPKKESIENAIKTLKENNVSSEKVQEIVDKLSLELVFTAHPTEAKSDIEILLLQEISETLRNNDLHQTSSLERQSNILMDNISPNEKKPTVTDEVHRNLLFFDSIYRVIPRIHRELKNAVKKYYPDVTVELKPRIKYASWVGGDRDGHPGVTDKVHYDTAQEHHKRAIAYHLDYLNDLERSTSTEKDKIQAIRNKLEKRISGSSGSYETPGELIADLEELNLTNETSQELLEDLLVNITSFGFHLAEVDTREHSKKHDEALTDIFSRDEIKSKLREKVSSFNGDGKTTVEKIINGEKYLNLSKDEKMAFLSALISSKDSLNISSILNAIPADEHDKNNTARIINTFNGITKIQDDLTPESANVQITSFTHDSSDVLEAVFFSKEAGLVTVEDNGSINSKLDFMPLFETIGDLDNSEVILSDLFKNDVYKKVLASRGNHQSVFLGYSDGTKDGGYAAAYAALWNAPVKIKEACLKSGIEGISWTVFHGRGGSLGRGGGKAGEAISSQAIGTIKNSIRITEQGEFISFRYSDPEMAFRHLEIRLEALIRASADVKECKNEHEDLFLDIGKKSFDIYRELFENPHLVDIIEKASPHRLIQYSNWGSRPSKRWDQSSTLDLEELRAIPWVVTWNQIRSMIPGWYGMGSTINKMLEEDSTNIEKLQIAYSESDAFRIMIDHCEMALAKSNMHAASLYRNLLEDGSPERLLFDQIINEHSVTANIINKIKGNKRLLDKNPIIQKRIDARNSYTHILNHIQVKLLRDLFSKLETDPEINNSDTKEIVKLGILSMKAIAAALQETG